MKRPLILSVALGMGFSPLLADINSPDAQGYLERGIAMLEADGNTAGAIDQLSRLHNLPCTPEQQEEALYYMALATLRSGDDEALPMIKEFLNRYPVSPRRATVMSLEADYYFDRSEWAMALKLYEQVNPMALTSERADRNSFCMGYCYMLLGEADTAAACFRTLQGRPAWRDAARFYLGYLAYRKKDFKTARSYFKGVSTAEAPGNAAPYYLAQIDFAEGNYQASLAASERLLREGTVPEFKAECNKLAGESLYNLGRQDEAIPYLWKYAAETKNPSPSAFYILGVSEYDRGDIDATVKLLQQAIGQHSAMEQSAWLYLGQAYMKRGDKTSALLAFENAYRMDYDPKVREEAFYNYAVARMDGAHVPFGNSVALLQDFLREYPNSAYASEVERYIVEGYMTDGDYESALRSIRQAKNPTPAMLKAKQRALFVLGSRSYAAGNVASAIRDLSEARSLRDGDPVIRRQCDLWLGDCYYARGNYQAAADAYQAYIKAAPATDTQNLALARYGLGYTHFAGENYAEAIKDFTAASQGASALSAESRAALLPDIYARLGDCRYYGRDYKGALVDYEKAISLNPEAADYPLFQTAMVKGSLNDYKGKIEAIDRLTADYPSSGLIATALLQKAESQCALGQTDAAVATYKGLVKSYPNSASGRNGHLQLAILYASAGRHDMAVATYREVVESYPSSEEARIAADDLKAIYAADGRLDEFVAFLGSVPGAPSVEKSELEAAAFTAAENAYLRNSSTAALEKYVADYPDGPGSPRALYYLATEAWNAGDLRKAETLAARLLKAYPDAEVAEDAMLIKARAEEGLGKSQTAFESFSRLESMASGSNMLRDARMGLLQTAADLGRHDVAVATADKILSSTAATATAATDEVRFRRAMSCLSLGRTSDAYADFSLLEKDMRSDYGARAAYNHALSLYGAGKRDKAKEILDALIASDTPQVHSLARGFILYSDILRAEGKTFEADEYLKSLRSNYPGSEPDIFQEIDARLK